GVCGTDAGESAAATNRPLSSTRDGTLKSRSKSQTQPWTAPRTSIAGNKRLHLPEKSTASMLAYFGLRTNGGPRIGRMPARRGKCGNEPGRVVSIVLAETSDVPKHVAHRQDA